MAKESLKKRLTEFGSIISKQGRNGTKQRFNIFSGKSVFYTLLMIACLTGLIYNVTLLVNDYFTYPVTTEISMEHKDTTHFPAITFCNNNRNTNGSVIYIKEMPDHEAEIGHRFVNMLKKCYFTDNEEHTIDCSHQDYFYWFYDYKYGNCFTFNFHLFNNGSERILGVLNGPAQMLMYINVEQEKYSSSTEEMGVRLVVHDHDTHPFPKLYGQGGPAGFSKIIKVHKQKRRIKLPPPYGKCEVADKAFNEKYSFYAVNYSYSKDACLETCRQVSIVQTLGCCLPPLPCNPLHLKEIFGIKLPGNLDYCDSSVYNKNKKANHLLENLHLLPAHCDYKCPYPCEEITYDHSSTLLEFPVENNDFERDYFEKYSSILGVSDNASTEEIHRAIRAEVLKFEIDLESLDVEKIETKAKYNWNRLISEIGGAIALFTGFSFITGFEIFHMVIDFSIQSCLCRRCSKKAAVGKNPSGSNSSVLQSTSDVVDVEDIQSMEASKSLSPQASLGSKKS